MHNWSRATATAQQIAAGWAGGPGGAIVLFDSGGPVQAVAGGLASLEHGLAFTPDTPNRYASISKHFLAATLLLEGVPMEAPLGALLPGLPAALAELPLGRALDMTGAVPDAMELLWQQGAPFTASLGAEAVFGLLRRLPGLCAAPGTEMAYSNSGWRLAQRILPDYPAALRQRLLEPLGLPIAFPLDEAEAVPGLATGYWQDGAAWRRGRYGMHFSASGGLAGSANALARWAAALMAGRGPLSGMLERLAAPRAFTDGTPSAYRLGLVETALGGTRLLAHGGSLPGYRNHLLLAPEQGVGVALLTNREEEALWPALRVMAALLGEAMPEPAANPTGLYASAEGPFWAELTPGAISVMGGHEALVADGDGGFRSLPAYLEMRLRVAPDGALEGRIGGAPRRLLPVPPGLAPDPALAGQWRDDLLGAELLIRPDGSARFPWAGSLGAETTLTPLPGGRALASLTHGPWRHRPCLWLEDGALRLASHRARILRFRR
ncbi:serine hydrolase [Teichococcus oryzae]|uniref:Serine hydrolase n=1 Tax=Teichococcus oryzae TaxID=1608942 RepID=A0A5B2THS2_9PROT|nr:serine hydrolase [Pseudoroseomonas oryzae]KAA2213654.1 serine hydrolase [Pseudoroseomonas oryzae]